MLEAHPGEEGEQTKVKLSTLEQKWETLQKAAEQRSTTFTGHSQRSCVFVENKMLFLIMLAFTLANRRASLEVILPRAQVFQEEVDGLQQWFISVEQDLAELRNAERVMLHLSEAADRAKVGNMPDMDTFVHSVVRVLCTNCCSLVLYKRLFSKRYKPKPHS